MRMAHVVTSRLGTKATILLMALASMAAISAKAFSQAGEPLTVAPTQGGQFTAVTVSGSNCGAGTPSVIGALTGPPGTGSAIEGTPFQTAVAVFTATPDAGGNWVASFTVPPFIPGGDYQVRPICKSDPNAATGAEYQPRPFGVLAGTSPTISVSPGQARAGQEVRLAVSGTLCQGPDAAVRARVFERVPESRGGDDFVASATFRPDAAGTWSGTVTIPATAPAGTYGVGATCQVGGTDLFNYVPVPEVVLTAAAVPTPPRRITLTG